MVSMPKTTDSKSDDHIDSHHPNTADTPLEICLSDPARNDFLELISSEEPNEALRAEAEKYKRQCA